MKLRIIFATALFCSVINVGVGFGASALQPLPIKDAVELSTAEKCIAELECNNEQEETGVQTSSPYKKWLLIAGGVAVFVVAAGTAYYFLYAKPAPKSFAEAVSVAPSIPVTVRPVVAANNGGGAVGECGICREPYTAQNPRIFQQCIHPFHGECIERWYAQCRHSGRPHTCPECRTVQQ